MGVEVAAQRRVLCFGNELHGDDGFGPAVGRRLAQAALPGGWTLQQVGTSGLDALALLQDCGAAILVDAEAPGAGPGACPGRLRERRADELRPEPVLVGHGMGLGFLLQALPQLRVADAPPLRLRILTAEMARLRSFDPCLSPAMARAVDAAVEWLRGWMAADAEGACD